jgi:hypothetical protein
MICCICKVFRKKPKGLRMYLKFMPDNFKRQIYRLGNLAGIIIFFITTIFSTGCGARRAKSVNTIGTEQTSKNYIFVNNAIINKNDTKRSVKQRLGSPTQIGMTLEGYQFYRYEEEKVEIYFDGDKVVGWTRLDFRP